MLLYQVNRVAIGSRHHLKQRIQNHQAHLFIKNQACLMPERKILGFLSFFKPGKSPQSQPL